MSHSIVSHAIDPFLYNLRPNLIHLNFAFWSCGIIQFKRRIDHLLVVPIYQLPFPFS